MDPKHISKITRIKQEYKSRETKKGIVEDGPYWYGYWIENGKTRRIYIGKKLPVALLPPRRPMPVILFERRLLDVKNNHSN